MTERNYSYNTYRDEYISLADYTKKTFYWMACGLAITFATAYFSYSSGLIYKMVAAPAALFVLLIAEIIMVMVLSSKVASLTVGTAQALFFGYAVLNGLVFGSYFVIYAASSLFAIFLLTALFFLVMAVYASITKTDLSTLRPLLFGGALVLALFWVASIFLDLSAFERLACTIGVAVFMLFTAYDVQKVKQYHAAFSSDPEMAEKSSIYAALGLYLDFVNLFVNLLRLFGKRRD